MKRELICISCPLGCVLTAEYEAGNEANAAVSGNTCPRGIVYARTELTDPRRIVTTTVRASDGRMLPVKTVRPVRKDKIFGILAALRDVEVTVPIRLGDVVLANALGESDIVAAFDLT